MFESYFSHQTAYVETARNPLGIAFILHVVTILLILAAPLAFIRELPIPISALSVFEALPPPPPPPPGGSAETKTKEIKPKDPDTLKEPDKTPQEMPKPDDKPPNPAGVVGGVEGGVEGGVVGGVLSATLLVKAQQRLSGMMPVFPQEAKAQGLSATIAARICISAQGDVTSAKILRGSPAFDEPVQKALMTWKYQPYMAGDTAVPACFPVYFKFNLKE